MPTVKTLLPQKQADVQLIRVAAYCRVSSDSTEQKESFAAQVEYYTGLIGGNPFWTLADIYADEGVTGTSMRKRDNFNRMIADCRRGKIDRIITKSVSRFARNTVECLDTVRKLSKIRQIIACIKVVAKDEILIIFKGGLERSVKLH